MTDFRDTDPLIEHGDDDADDDEGATYPFQYSTPGPSGEEIPMTTMNRERERSAATAAEPTTVDTSFIEDTSGRRVNSDSLKIQAANLNLERMYPNYGRDGNFFNPQDLR